MSEKIGIVTVLYNCVGVLNDFFETLEQQTYKNFELIIVDNASKDESLLTSKKLAEAVSFDCYFIENTDNVGVAKGNNQGIKLALDHSCDKVLLSNNDIVLENNTIEELYRKHIENKADLSVPKIYYFNSNKLWYAGGSFDKLKGVTVHFGYKEDDTGVYNQNCLVTYAPTCFMLINSDVFSLVGFMDEKFFVYYDDTDFVYRCVYYNKLKLYYSPNSTIEHKVSFSTGNDSDFTIRYMMRNRIYFAKKHSRIPILIYLINYIYHYTIRNLKFYNKRHQWNVIRKAIIEGWKI